MTEYEHKQDIINTRKGCLGGSDAATLAQIANLGIVPKSAYKRMALCKGLIEPQDNFASRAMQYGDYVENTVFELLSKETDKELQSNPLWVSERYSEKNVKLICHPDIAYEDEDKQTIFVYECKATKDDLEMTRHKYRAQMYIENLLAKERAAQKGKRWKVKSFLVHYDTNGLNLEDGFSFDTDRLTVKPVNFPNPVFDVKKAMLIVNNFLATFDVYYEGDEIDYNYLPSNVKKQFDLISSTLAEIKARETLVNDFKSKLYEFLQDKGIKSIKSDSFSVTLVNPAESVSVDYKALFAQEIESKRPRAAKKLKEKYKKTTRRNGFVVIKIKEQQ